MSASSRDSEGAQNTKVSRETLRVDRKRKGREYRRRRGGEEERRGGRGSEETSRLTPLFIRILQPHGRVKPRRVFSLMPHIRGKRVRLAVSRIFLAASPCSCSAPTAHIPSFPSNSGARRPGPRVLMVTNDRTLSDRCREAGSAPVEVPRRGEAVGAVLANQVYGCRGG